MFGLFRRLTRRRLSRRPMPEAWLTHLERRVPFFRDIEGPLRERFLTQLKVFAWEKEFIGAGGQEIDDEVRVVVSAAAVRLVLYLDLPYYDRLTEIIVYPEAFRRPDEETWILGEAHTWGTVVLAWKSVLLGLANQKDAHDTATHEFAHVLDQAGGAFDGTPELRASAHYRPWAQVMTRNYLALRRGGTRARKVLRQYGATNEAEFFAVATEAFFEKPRDTRPISTRSWSSSIVVAPGVRAGARAQTSLRNHGRSGDGRSRGWSAWLNPRIATPLRDAF